MLELPFIYISINVCIWPGKYYLFAAYISVGENMRVKITHSSRHVELSSLFAGSGQE